MNEEQIRSIVQDEIMKNYNSGSPIIPPHSHNSTDNLQVDYSDIAGTSLFAQLPVAQKEKAQNRIIIVPSIENGTLGIGPGASIYPLPVISGDLGAEDLPFTGDGTAPDGTLFLYKRATAWQLWICLFGSWHGVDLPLTP